MDYRGRGRLDGRPHFPKVGWRSEHWSKSIVEGRDCREQGREQGREQERVPYDTTIGVLRRHNEGAERPKARPEA
jgi:hypothetical protein